MKIICLLSLLPLLSSATTEQPKDVEPALCGAYKFPMENQQTYHGDQVCDRTGYNKFKTSLKRYRTHQRLKVHNEINLVPNQKTVVCPLEVQDLRKDSQAPQSTGFDSVWIVENTSSEPVVLSFVYTDGIEYSAVNSHITPPQNDPEAILSPTQWKAVFAWDGHVFHARSYDSESGNLGPVVMQHRLGLIPVGSKFQDLVCPQEDPEPIIAETGVRDPKFSRTPSAVHRPCNTIDIGFRNMANCPLNGYYVHKNETICQEKFKFHMGKNTQPSDFMWQWDSPTKFEGSFVGHSFAFRSAANPDILVETVTLQPSRIIDCPELKNKAQINQVTRVGQLVEIALPLTNGGDGVITKAQQLEDTLLRVDRTVMAAVFNQTYADATNGTSNACPRRRSRYVSARAPIVGMDSL